MTATFWSQGWGQLAAALVAISSLAAFKKQILNDPVDNARHLDFVWRLIIGLGAVPGAVALYFRLTLPETPRFTMDVERNIKQAATDVDAFLQTGAYVQDSTPATTATLDVPKASWKDFRNHFGQWKHGKVLFGTAWSWFALDIAFYGLGLNSSIIFNAIGYGTVTSGTAQYNRYHTLFNNAVGNIIVTCAGLIPGFWAAFALIDSWGRKPLYVPTLSLERRRRSAGPQGRRERRVEADVFLFLALQPAHGLHRPHDHPLLHGLRLRQAQGECRRRLRLPVLPQCVLVVTLSSFLELTSPSLARSQLPPELRPQHDDLRHSRRDLPYALPLDRARHLGCVPPRRPSQVDLPADARSPSSSSLLARLQLPRASLVPSSLRSSRSSSRTAAARTPSSSTSSSASSSSPSRRSRPRS